jgi:hypothetical protein
MMTVHDHRNRGCVFDDHREMVERRHALVHGTPEAPYECPECDDEFWSVEEWQDHHMDAHYPGGDEA